MTEATNIMVCVSVIPGREASLEVPQPGGQRHEALLSRGTAGAQPANLIVPRAGQLVGGAMSRLPETNDSSRRPLGRRARLDSHSSVTEGKAHRFVAYRPKAPQSWLGER